MKRLIVLVGLVAFCSSFLLDHAFAQGPNNIFPVPSGKTGIGSATVLPAGPADLLHIHGWKNAPAPYNMPPALRVSYYETSTGPWAWGQVGMATGPFSFGQFNTSRDFCIAASQEAEDMFLTTHSPVGNIYLSTTPINTPGTYSDIIRMTVTNTGNVGIGTTTPKDLLQLGENLVIHGSVPNGEINFIGRNAYWSAGDYKRMSSNPGSILYQNFNGDIGFMGFGSSLSATDPLGATHNMVWKNSGRLGINIDDPLSALHVYGHQILEDAAGAGVLSFPGAGALPNFYLRSYTGNNPSAYTDRMIVDGVTGNVMIGTNNTLAAEKLEVNGNIRLSGGTPAAGGRSVQTGSDSRLNLYSNKDAYDSKSFIELWGPDDWRSGELNLAGKYIDFRYNAQTGGGTVGMRFNEQGRLGIGTQFPAAKLDVKGPVWIDAAGAAGPPHEMLQIGDLFTFWSDSYGSKTISRNAYWDPPTNSLIRTSNGPSSQLFFNTGGEAGLLVWPNGTGGQPAGAPSGGITLKNNGSVWIGGVTSPPNNPSGNPHKLVVDGSILAREFVVRTDWADYVFSPEYKLRSLPALEEEIKILGHLPGIPSAKEVAQRGVELGTAQVKLLEKVEELTLYVINQNNQIKQLQQKNQELEASIQQLKDH